MEEELVTEYAVRYKNLSTARMGEGTVYTYLTQPNRGNAEAALELVLQPHRRHPDAVIVEREVSAWRVSE